MGGTSDKATVIEPGREPTADSDASLTLHDWHIRHNSGFPGSRGKRRTLRADEPASRATETPAPSTELLSKDNSNGT